MESELPRVWPVLLLGALFLPIVTACTRLVSAIFESAGVEGIDQVLFYASIGQSIEFGLLFWLVRRSREQPAERLMIREGRLSLWYSPLVYVGAFAAVTIGSMVTILVFGAPSPRMQAIGNAIQSGEAGGLWSFLLLVAVAPALAEELIFRGYIQSRLLKRYSAWTAIFISSIFFSIAHGDIRYACAIFPLGMWFGYVTYISESVWPSVVCHFIQNSLVVLAAWSAPQRIGSGSPSALNEFSGPEYWPVLLVFFAIAGLVVAWMARILKRGRRPASSLD